MFFKHEKPKVVQLEERIRTLDGLNIRSAVKANKATLMRGVCAAEIEQTAPEQFRILTLGIVVGNEIGELVDGGNQKFWLTPGGKRQAATADQLQALHEFSEDIRESLAMTSLYNEGLGSVSAQHLYDRVKGRDAAS